MSIPSWLRVQRRKCEPPGGRSRWRRIRERGGHPLSLSRFLASVGALSVMAVGSLGLFLREEGIQFFSASSESAEGHRAVSDAWILLISDQKELLGAYRKVARLEAETGNDDYEVYFARDADELYHSFVRANRHDRVYSLFVVSHASTGMLSYMSNGVDLRVDPSDLPGGRLDSGGIGQWTDVWFYGCRFAGDDLSTSTYDWMETGRIWSRFFNGARVWGNTGWVNLNSFHGSGQWMHYQMKTVAAQHRERPERGAR